MRRLVQLFATVAVLVLIASNASAACPSLSSPNGGPFYIEGIVGDTNGDPCNNSGVSPGALKTTDPNGSVQELGPTNKNNKSVKVNVINSANPPMLDFTDVNAQTDLSAVYTQAALAPATNELWFYFGWSRISSSGSGFVAIEFDRGAKPSACIYAGVDLTSATSAAGLISGCNPWANRIGDGSVERSDFMILWDQQGSSRDTYVRYYDSALKAFGAPKLLTSQAVTAYSSDFFKGELAINFTALVGNPQSCISFANVLPGTVTGNSDTADYKDAVLADFPLVSSCGTVTVTKVTQPGGLSGTFPYTLSASSNVFYTGGVDSDCANAQPDLTKCEATLTSDGDNDTIANLIGSNSYTLAEGTVSAGFELVSISCSVDGATVSSSTSPLTSISVVATKTTACTITNRRLPGTFRVRKVVVNGFGLVHGSQDFCYSLNGGQNVNFQSNSGFDSYTQQAGTVNTVVEPAACQIAGYTATYNNCSSVTVTPGGTQTCTVTNTAGQNNPAAVTRQRTLLFDRANLSNVRRTGDGTDANTFSVKFIVYSSLAACNADSAGAGAGETVPVTFASNTATTAQVGSTGNPAVEIKLDTAGTLDETRWWRAVLHQTGVNPPNGDFVTPCTESTEVKIVQ